MQELRNTRYWLAGLLPDYPPRADVLTVATELAGNAVRHSASGRDGYFAVEISWLARPATIRIAVADGGGPASPAGLAALSSPGTGPFTARVAGVEPLAESGRGLRLVRALSLRAGMCGGEQGRLVWADVRWGPDDQPEPGFPDGYRAALRDVQAVLAARYPEAAIWFGQATMHWWAMVGDPAGPDSRLLTAESPLELARLLDLDRARQRLVRRPSRGRHGATGRRASTGPRPVSWPGLRPATPARPAAPGRRVMPRREAAARPLAGALAG